MLSVCAYEFVKNALVRDVNEREIYVLSELFIFVSLSTHTNTHITHCIEMAECSINAKQCIENTNRGN